MNKRTPETISTLVDGELNDWEWKAAIQTLEQDRELQSCWRNYHLVGDAMRGGLPKYLGLDLADRVSRALEREPFHFKPQNPSLPSSNQLSRTKTAIGFALAASLSAVAVFGVLGVEQKQKLHGADQVASAAAEPSEQAVAAPSAGEPGGAVMTVAENAPADTAVQKPQPKFLGTLMPVKPMLVAEKKGAAPVQSRRAQGTLVARSLPAEGDLYDYLLNYHQYSAQNDNEDALSYLRDVRVVSYATSQ
jgi:sigma-E factor negative regulatory protein RseA